MKRAILPVFILVFLAGLMLLGQKHPIGLGGGPTTAAGVVALFSSCSGTQYLGADGACHAAGGSGTVTSVIGTANQITSDGSTTTPTLSIPSTFIGPGSVTATTTLGAKGATSGTVTITAPAIAGTATNPALFSNSLQLPTGTVYNWNADAGMSRVGAGNIAFGNGTAADTQAFIQFKGANLSTWDVNYSTTKTAVGALDFVYAWNTAATTGGTVDTGLYRAAANVVGVSTGGNAASAGYLQFGTVAVGSLPAAAAGNKGRAIYVTDSTAVAVEGQTCVGGSSNAALAFSNGVIWKCF